MEYENTIIPFRLRGLDGRVEIGYSTNDDPRRWGYPLLESALGFSSERAEGFPVVSAQVAYPGEGYVSCMGWIQIVRWREAGNAEEQVIVDKPPQLSDESFPYCFWGLAPSFFDAPSTTARLELWSAHTFLVASPDAVITKEVRPVCGFSWGFSTLGPRPEAMSLLPLGEETWSAARHILAGRYPSWCFEAWWYEDG